MKTIEKKIINRQLKPIYIEDKSLNRFDGKELFKEKIVQAKETFNKVKLPPR